MAEDVTLPEPDAADPEAPPFALPENQRLPQGIQAKYLFSFILTMVVVILVLVMLPSTAVSMVQELRTQAEGQLFDMFTGKQVPVNSAMTPNQTFINVTVTNIDEAAMIASLTLSGHRECPIACPETTATFYSLGNDAARRRGLPPSTTVTVPADEGSYSFGVQLPIRGQPQRYPFDDYTLLLGIVVANTFPGGVTVPVTRAEVAAHTVSFTLEDLVTRLDMIPPQAVDPAAVRSPNDPTDFMLVDELQWQRPRYLRILTVLLVLLTRKPRQYRRLLIDAQRFLAPQGLLLMELGQGQAAAVAALSDAVGGYAPVRLIEDAAGIERVIIAQRRG